MRLIWLCLLAMTALLAEGQDGRLRLEGWLSAGGQRGNGPPSWLTGDVGKLSLGEASGDAATLRGQLGVTYEPNLYVKAHVHLLAREEPSENRGEAFGVPEAYLEATAYGGAGHQVRWRLGWFFPSTSMENVDPLWASPYTLSFSAINSWIGEEMRPAGLDVRYSLDRGNGTFYLEGSLLAGNDSLGALLAWRGWSLGQRLTVWDELLPLPPLTSFEPGAPFSLQHPGGTRPLRVDLDSEPGYSGRLGWEVPGFLLLANYLDNGGDRALYEGDYAWETRLWQLGFALDPGDHLTILGEYMDGETGMGMRTRGHAQVNFDAWYLLASLELQPFRLSLRYDRFRTRDLDRLNGFPNVDLNEEDGDALTAAMMWEPLTDWRLALEWLDLEADRDAKLTTGLRPHGEANTWTLEARYHF